MQKIITIILDLVKLVLEHHIGCSGWSYDGWKGPFYPEDLDNKYWLSYYSQIFDFVEIDYLLQNAF